ncbi:MAG: type II toxin-antitoxin system RelE/ParE family toxin [Bacteroidota bacterium]|nr:type II toxin-antitoxin system RelE/ParE family toxin [Bacteroidota bacterium]
MTVEFDRSFERSLDRITDQKLADKIIQLIEKCEASSVIGELQGVKKLSGYSTYYRFRIGDYRIGVELIGVKTIRFILVGHRKEFYRKFP